MTSRVAIIVARPIEDDPYVVAFRECCAEFEVELLHSHVPPNDAAAALSRSSALLLTGGADIHPERYGESPAGAEMKPVQPARDELEIVALARADVEGWPILALCRGMQMLNVHYGGALIQDIGESHRLTPRPAKEDLWRPLHPVTVSEGSALYRAVGAPTMRVNSRHHQAVDRARIGAGVTVSALAPDGTIEAIEVPGERFILGVQWHPENMVFAPEGSPERSNARAIFAAFEQAIRNRPATTEPAPLGV
ncbi:MAG: gamma-glutamyl-gamma-aminobutyrate hydrolase family protein [Dehalococcoidia bacterium]